MSSQIQSHLYANVQKGGSVVEQDSLYEDTSLGAPAPLPASAPSNRQDKEAANIYEHLRVADAGKSDTDAVRSPSCQGRGLLITVIIAGIAVTLLVGVAIGLAAAAWGKGTGNGECFI